MRRCITDRNDTILIVKKFKKVLQDMPERYNLVDTEKNAVEYGIDLFNKELNKLVYEHKEWCARNNIPYKEAKDGKSN